LFIRHHLHRVVGRFAGLLLIKRSDLLHQIRRRHHLQRNYPYCDILRLVRVQRRDQLLRPPDVVIVIRQDDLVGLKERLVIGKKLPVIRGTIRFSQTL